jgi:tetratricopeptide (TPR) repeat protein
MRSIHNYRSNFLRLAKALAAEGQKEKAVEVLDYSLEVLPEETVPYNYFVLMMAELYFQLGEIEKGTVIAERIVEISDHDLAFYYNGKHAGRQYMGEKRNALYMAQEIQQLAAANGKDELAKNAENVLKRYGQIFNMENQ